MKHMQYEREKNMPRKAREEHHNKRELCVWCGDWADRRQQSREGERERETREMKSEMQRKREMYRNREIERGGIWRKRKMEEKWREVETPD